MIGSIFINNDGNPLLLGLKQWKSEATAFIRIPKNKLKGKENIQLCKQWSKNMHLPAYSLEKLSKNRNVFKLANIKKTLLSFFVNYISSLFFWKKAHFSTADVFFSAFKVACQICCPAQWPWGLNWYVEISGGFIEHLHCHIYGFSGAIKPRQMWSQIILVTCQ